MLILDDLSIVANRYVCRSVGMSVAFSFFSVFAIIGHFCITAPAQMLELAWFITALSARLQHSDIPPRPHHVGNMRLKSEKFDLVGRFSFIQ